MPVSVGPCRGASVLFDCPQLVTHISDSYFTAPCMPSISEGQLNRRSQVCAILSAELQIELRSDRGAGWRTISAGVMEVAMK